MEDKDDLRHYFERWLNLNGMFLVLLKVTLDKSACEILKKVPEFYNSNVWRAIHLYNYHTT